MDKITDEDYDYKTDNEINKMKQKAEYYKIDSKFIEAIDKIIEINSSLGIKPSNDSSIGKKIYPPNRSIISSVRSKSKHIPHLALINFAREFNVDMNYFYYTGVEFKYGPIKTDSTVIQGNGVNSVGKQNINIHSVNGNVKGGVSSDKVPTNTVNGVDTMINNFASKLNDKFLSQFYLILNKIQIENRKVLDKLDNIIKEKTRELKSTSKEYKVLIASLQAEVRLANEKVFEAQRKENEVLQKYIMDLKNMGAK